MKGSIFNHNFKSKFSSDSTFCILFTIASAQVFQIVQGNDSFIFNFIFRITYTGVIWEIGRPSRHILPLDWSHWVVGYFTSL